MQPVAWVLFAAVIVALLWWVYTLRRRVREQAYRIARLQRDVAKLQAATEKARATTDSLGAVAPDAMLLVDTQRRVTTMNEAAQSVFQRPPGGTVIETTRSHEIHQLIDDALKGKASLARQIAVGDRVFRAQTVPIDGVGAAVSLQDLTELGRLTRARRDLVANVSHEIRTPLTAIKLLVETLLHRGLDNAEMNRQLLSKIEGQVEILEQLTQELFDLSEIESGRAPIRMVKTAMADLVDEAIHRLGPHAQRKDVQVRNLVSPELCSLADPEKVERVLTNLLHNAIKFTPADGSVEVRGATADVAPGGGPDGVSDGVSDAAAEAPSRDGESTDELDFPEDHPPGSWTAISVIDTGQGIPPAHLPRIFERLYKVDRSRKAGEGTGLGLAIAKHIVEGHGGRIWATNLDPSGAKFTFTLPSCA